MKKFSLILFFMAFFAINSNAVLKEKDLSNTLDILREELTKEHKEQERRTEFYKQQNEQVRNELFGIIRGYGTLCQLQEEHPTLPTDYREVRRRDSALRQSCSGTRKDACNDA